MKYLCDVCMEEGEIRQPKGFSKSNNPSLFVNLVVRCDKHLGLDME